MISVVRWHDPLFVYDDDGKRDAGPSTEELWELYQKTGSYEDMTRWLKHAAYERIEERSGVGPIGRSWGVDRS